MGIALVTIGIIAACGWLGLSVFLAVAEAQAAMLHSDYVRCVKCHHHYFAPQAGPRDHDCARIGFEARAWDLLARPVRHLHGKAAVGRTGR